MRQTTSSNSRRAFIKTSVLGLGVLGASASASASATVHKSDPFVMAADTAAKQPVSDIAAWFTNGKQRFAAGRPIQWQPASTPPATDSIQLIAANKFQDILGFGGCFSDASCYVINQLHPPLREQLLHEMFYPSEMGLSVKRPRARASALLPNTTRSRP